MDSQQVEKVARAMWAAETCTHPSLWDDGYINKITRDRFRDSALNAIRAHSVRHLLNEMAAGVE